MTIVLIEVVPPPERRRLPRIVTLFPLSQIGKNIVILALFDLSTLLLLPFEPLASLFGPRRFLGVLGEADLTLGEADLTLATAGSVARRAHWEGSLAAFGGEYIV